MTYITNFIHDHKLLCIAVGILWLIGIFMMLFLTGHTFLGMFLVGVGALLIFYPLCAMLLHTVPILKLLRTAVTVVLIICVGYFCVVEAFIIKDARTETDTPADYIIVLGAGVNGTVPSLSLRDRLVGTYDYMTANPNCIAIVSGGQGEGEDITEALCMRDWLVERGIAPDRILMEDKATSTVENLRNTLALLGETPERVTILSSEFHLYRAGRMAQDLGIEASLVPAGTDNLPLFINYFLRDIFALWKYIMLGG